MTDANRWMCACQMTFIPVYVLNVLVNSESFKCVSNFFKCLFRMY